MTKENNMEFIIKKFAKPCPKCDSNTLEFLCGFCYGTFFVTCKDCNYMGKNSKDYEKCPDQADRMLEALNLWNNEERK